MTLALVMSKRGAWTGWDYVIGLACALLVAGIGAARGRSRFAPVGGFLADISYTLYLTHFPVLALLWFVPLLTPRNIPPVPRDMACWHSPSRSHSVLLAWRGGCSSAARPRRAAGSAGRLARCSTYPAGSAQTEE